MIIRRRHTSNFTTISNVLFEDQRLAADEVGILAFLISRPHDWEVRRAALQRRWGIGASAMKRIVRSWMRAGWCQATKIRLPNGTFCILYDISDLPGKELSDDEITEALSLVSSEVSRDGSSTSEDPDEPGSIPDTPPPTQPGVDDQGLVTGGVAYIDKQNTDLPRDDSYQKPERELTRAREKHALNLAEFKRRWPTAASDDQTKIDAEWFALEFDQGDAALAGIVPFLEKLKRDKRTTVPAGWKYLKDKRWTLLEAASATEPSVHSHLLGSPAAKAIITAHEIAGLGDYLRSVMIRQGAVNYLRPVTPRLLALADAGAKDEWAHLTRQQAGAWDEFLRENITARVHRPLREGDRAPRSWPPRKDGTWPTAGPSPELSEQDIADFR